MHIKKGFLRLNYLTLFFFILFFIMVSVILSDTQSFDPKFKFGIDIKENKTSKEVGNHQSAVKIQAAALNHR